MQYTEGMADWTNRINESQQRHLLLMYGPARIGIVKSWAEEIVAQRTIKVWATTWTNPTNDGGLRLESFLDNMPENVFRTSLKRCRLWKSLVRMAVHLT